VRQGVLIGKGSEVECVLKILQLRRDARRADDKEHLRPNVPFAGECPEEASKGTQALSRRLLFDRGARPEDHGALRGLLVKAFGDVCQIQIRVFYMQEFTDLNFWRSFE